MQTPNRLFVLMKKQWTSLFVVFNNKVPQLHAQMLTPNSPPFSEPILLKNHTQTPLFTKENTSTTVYKSIHKPHWYKLFIIALSSANEDVFEHTAKQC